MGQPDSQVSYASFRNVVECAGRLATHPICGDQYVSSVAADDPCSSKTDSNLLLCDYCLAFWWQCRENRDIATWETALFFRDQYQAEQVDRGLSSYTEDCLLPWQ
jgi:hypothetical protein